MGPFGEDLNVPTTYYRSNLLAINFVSTADSDEIHISVNSSSLPAGICLPFLQHWKVNSLHIDAQGLGVNWHTAIIQWKLLYALVNSNSFCRGCWFSCIVNEWQICRNIMNCFVHFHQKGTFFHGKNVYIIMYHKGYKAEGALSINLGSNSQGQFSFSSFVEDWVNVRD